MKRIFGKIWLVWAAIIFFLSWPFVWIAYQFVRFFLPKSKHHNAFFNITKSWGKYVNFFLGIRTECFGLNKIDPKGQYIYVCNHRSQIDIPINFTTTPQPFVILSKKEATKIPVVGTNLRLAHVTVDRNNPEDRKRSMDELQKCINDGKSILLYPEGRRNYSSEKLEKFKAGAFLLAIQNGLPIVPITIVGSENINNPKDPMSVLPGLVHIFFDDPVPTVNLTKDDLKGLIEVVRQEMLSHLPKN